MKELDKYLDKITEKKSILKEGFYRPENSSYWIEEAIAIAENINKLVEISNKYIKDVEKEAPEKAEYIALQVTVKIDSQIKNILDKTKRNKSFITLILRDTNDSLDKLHDGIIETIKSEIDWIK
jgi:hypothetical protein